MSNLICSTCILGLFPYLLLSILATLFAVFVTILRSLSPLHTANKRTVIVCIHLVCLFEFWVSVPLDQEQRFNTILSHFHYLSLNYYLTVFRYFNTDVFNPAIYSVAQFLRRHVHYITMLCSLKFHYLASCAVNVFFFTFSAFPDN